jgi:hypothetical protein
MQAGQDASWLSDVCISMCAEHDLRQLELLLQLQALSLQELRIWNATEETAACASAVAPHLYGLRSRKRENGLYSYGGSSEAPMSPNVPASAARTCCKRTHLLLRCGCNKFGTLQGLHARAGRAIE